MDPQEVIDLVLRIPKQAKKLQHIDDELWLISSGDGTGEGHHKKFPLYSETIRFPQMHDSLSVNECHPILVARMSESVRAHQKHSSGVFRLLENVVNTKQKVSEQEKTVRMSRCADGSEYAKGCGTSTFGSRCPCPACGRKMVDLRKLSSLGECAKDQRREYDNPDCDHTLDSCICNKHCMDKLASAFPITDRKNNGCAPWDDDHPQHKKVLDYCMDNLHGYTHPAMNSCDWIGQWQGIVNYDPLHSDLNCFKVLFTIITDMHVVLDIENNFAKRLSCGDIKMEMINVGQDDPTVKEIRAQYGDNVRDSHGELLGKEKTALLNQRAKISVDGTDFDSFAFLEALAAFANEDGPHRHLAIKMFKVAHKLTDLFNRASKLLLNHTRLVNESSEFRTLVDAYYKCMHDEVGAKLSMDSWETYFKWPDHQKAEHMADDMDTFFKLTGMPLGVASCEVQEALNHYWKVQFTHTNQHTSTTNMDDNKFKQVMRDKYLQFLKDYPTRKKRGQRPFKYCLPCAELGWNLDAYGDQIRHQISKRCARPPSAKEKKRKGDIIPLGLNK